MSANTLPIRFPAGVLWRRTTFAFTGSVEAALGSVRSFEPGCVVPEDPGEVVRGARPISPQDRERMREQEIARMMADYHRQQSHRPVLHARSA
jgi:hypothetical protein